jgi:hypothetical protein
MHVVDALMHFIRHTKENRGISISSEGFCKILNMILEEIKDGEQVNFIREDLAIHNGVDNALARFYQDDNYKVPISVLLDVYLDDDKDYTDKSLALILLESENAMHVEKNIWITWF